MLDKVYKEHCRKRVLFIEVYAHLIFVAPFCQGSLELCTSKHRVAAVQRSYSHIGRMDQFTADRRLQPRNAVIPDSGTGSVRLERTKPYDIFLTIIIILVWNNLH